MTVTATRRFVLDSTAFLVAEYDTDILEGRRYDPEVLVDMHAAAVRLLAPRLRRLWDAAGYDMIDADRHVYHALTVSEDDGVVIGSLSVPSDLAARDAWYTVIADVTADDIEEEARRA